MDIELLVLGLSGHLAIEAGLLVVSLLQLVLPVLFNRYEVSIEPEFVLSYGVSEMCSLHVFILKSDWKGKVQVEVVNYVGQHTSGDDEAHVLEISHLNVHWSKLNSPPDFGVLGRWWLEPH